MVLGRSACLRYAKVQDLIHEFVNQHEVIFDAELAELAAEVRSEQCHNLRHGERECVTRGLPQRFDRWIAIIKVGVP